MNYYALVLAAGKGTRLKSDIPKCAYPILKKPIIEYTIEKFEETKLFKEIVCVVGYKKETFYELLGNRVLFAEQKEQKGTADAVLSAKSVLSKKEGATLIIPGDVPLITPNLIKKILNVHGEMGNDLTLVTMNVDNPKGYGRIVRNKYHLVEKIVEDKNCDEHQKTIKEVNTGIYVVNNKHLFKVLDKVTPNSVSNEYYLTDIVELMNRDYKINTFNVYDNWQTFGVNDLYEMSVAEKHLRVMINKNHMLNGVEIVNPETVTIGHDVIIEPSVMIAPNTTITGKSVIKTGSVIGPNSEVHNSNIHENVHVKHSLIYDSTVNKNSTIGPFAHLRNKAVIGENNRIGNYVEVKNSKTGDETKAAHLSYIGDATVGDRVNFGCGSITVNYDGVNKHQTVIGDDVFIGCNVNMVAPINISDSVFIAAGSTVTKDIPKGSLSINRGKQINKADYYSHLIKPKAEDEKK